MTTNQPNVPWSPTYQPTGQPSAPVPPPPPGEGSATGLTPTGPPDPPVINWDVFTKSSARSRALRTFAIGLILAVVWGIVTAIGQASNVDWFSREGWATVGTLVVSSVVASLLSYIARIRFEPNYTLRPGKHRK